MFLFSYQSKIFSPTSFRQVLIRGGKKSYLIFPSTAKNVLLPKIKLRFSVLAKTKIVSALALSYILRHIELNYRLSALTVLPFPAFFFFIFVLERPKMWPDLLFQLYTHFRAR